MGLMGHIRPIESYLSRRSLTSQKSELTATTASVFFPNDVHAIRKSDHPTIARIARRNIRIDVRQFTHARNYRADVRIAENEAQRHLRPGTYSRATSGLEFFGALNTGNQILRREIDVAPIAFRPLAVFRQSPGQSAFIKRDSRDDRDVVFSDTRETIRPQDSDRRCYR